MISQPRTEPVDIWSRLAAPLPAGVISWRQDGRTINRDGRFLARFVAYIEANTVRERLDSVVPGEWDLHLEPLPPVVSTDEDANMGACNFKARLSILGVVREDVGTGKDWKQAATDAMKRVAVRFGIGHELYAYEHNWVQMDGDGKFARPVEDPAVAYARRYGRPKAASAGGPALVRAESAVGTEPAAVSTAPRADGIPDATGEPSCPKCGGKMWDDRRNKRNPKAPDFKCRDKQNCDGVIWPPKAEKAEKPAPEPRAAEPDEIPF
jgi:hypothetical protein